MASSIVIRRRLRPLRIAFLVRPGDRASLGRIIEINTCIWGGRFNAIVPLQQRGVRLGRSRWSRDQVVEGLLERFEPDFVIDTTTDGPCDFDPDRVISEGDVFDRSRNGYVTYGISMNDVMRHAYSEEYRFVRRNKPSFVLPTAGAGARSLWLAAAFGRFPATPGHFELTYCDVFEPARETIDASNLLPSLRLMTPLKLSAWDLRIHGGAQAAPAVFVMNSDRGADIIDYWNLRALGWPLIPFPLQWRDRLLPHVRREMHELIEQYVAAEVRILGTMVVAARSVPEALATTIAKEIGDGAAAPVRVLPRYPALWDPSVRSRELARCSLSAANDETTRVLRGSPKRHWISLSPLAPPFEPPPYFASDARWANVLSMQDPEAPVPAVAPVVPSNLLREAQLFGIGRGGASVNSEGVTVYAGGLAGDVVYVPSPLKVAAAWFEARGYSCQISAAGRIASTMVRKLGGLHAAMLLASPELLKELNKMSHAMVDRVDDDSVSARRGAQARFRTQKQQKMLGLLGQLNRGHGEVALRHLQRLVDAEVFRIGLELRCPACTQRTWFALDDLGDHLRCDRCLSEFSFPAAKPPRSEAWTYRTQGVFSIENFAHGSYAVVLSLRLLATQFHSYGFTWIPSVVLKGPEGGEIEVDFAMWQDNGSGDGVSLLLGEAKSFGDFEDDDFKKARRLREAFPGAYLVFATLKDGLSDREVTRLRTLARQGRKPGPRGTWRSPVIVLTGREIFHDSGPPACWRGQGGLFARAATICKAATDLQSLAQATQLAWLGLDPQEELLRATKAMREVAASGDSA